MTGIKKNREATDDYPWVVSQLSDRHRVIICQDRIQWIVQRSDGERDGRKRWTGIGYFRTRDALIRFCRTLPALYEPREVDILAEKLPASAQSIERAELGALRVPSVGNPARTHDCHP